MEYYLAPMEGITGYVYRNAYNKVFERFDKYYTPFIAAHEKVGLGHREISDIDPENNKGMKLIPQMLVNRPEEYFLLEKSFLEYGYNETNLNFGCPNKTVTVKGRGAGALRDKDALKKLLDTIFEKATLKISVKTRIGYESEEEFDELIRIYNDFPLTELIVHPRLGTAMYKGTANVDLYDGSVSKLKMPCCYNGDIKAKEDIKKIKSLGEKTTAVMIGRGVIADPFLLGNIKEGVLKNEKRADIINRFLDELEEGYVKEMSGETPVLFKLKEVWSYLGKQFVGQEKELKKLVKCTSLGEYRLVKMHIVSSMKD